MALSNEEYLEFNNMNLFELKEMIMSVEDEKFIEELKNDIDALEFHINTDIDEIDVLKIFNEVLQFKKIISEEEYIERRDSILYFKDEIIKMEKQILILKIDCRSLELNNKNILEEIERRTNELNELNYKMKKNIPAPDSLIEKGPDITESMQYCKKAYNEFKRIRRRIEDAKTKLYEIETFNYSE